MMDEAPAPDAADEKRPLTEEDTPEGSGETMHVPLEFLQGAKLKEGDELRLKVVSVDDKGLEVAYAKASRDTGDASSELDALDQGSDSGGY